MSDHDPDRAGSSSGLLRSSVLVAAGTGLSRVTGLLRIMAIAYALGTRVLADAYNLANTTPNVVYDLVLGGILAATLVPVIVDRNEHGDRSGVDALATVVTVALVAVTVLATAASPLIIRLYTVDLPAEEAQRQASLAVPLLVMFMPQVLFYGLTTLWTALLNARRSFAVPAFAPVLNNVVVIALFLALPRLAGGKPTLEQVRDDTGLLVLVGIGTTAGIVAMTLVLWPAMRRAGIRLRWNPDWRNPAVSTVARLSGWTLGYVAANQVVFFAVLTLANGTGEGAVSAYTYAWLFVQLPYGLFTVSIMTTFTPELATHASRGDLPAFRSRFAQGLRLGLLVILPAAAAYLVLATPIVGFLLQRGSFTEASTELTASALVWFAAGLPGFAVFLYTMRGFYAFRDTRSPFLLNLCENVLQVGLAVVLVRRFGLPGVIAAFALAYSAAAVAALAVLARRAGPVGVDGLWAAVVRQGVAAASMVAVMVVVTRVVTPGGSGEYVTQALVGGAAGALTYLGVLALVRSDDLRALRALGARIGARPDSTTMP
ncbi:murein biosynthesis integral membrane protein MurJ [Rhabdothermincola sp.]|uniref:murein biosynthesis integral membrane protein MurJ n=1 Tax=Rhabdothermincola sp. TaxID=2820405 RepID=UPI002FE411F8